MADRVTFKGTRKLEKYVAGLAKQMNNSLGKACEDLSRRSVEKTREELQKKKINMSGQLYESLIPIPGPYVDMKKGVARIGFTQQAGMADYGIVQEFGSKKWSKHPKADRLLEWTTQKTGRTGSDAKRFAYMLGKKIKRRGLEGQDFGKDGLKNLVPEISGKIFTQMRKANTEAARKANRDNR